MKETKDAINKWEADRKIITAYNEVNKKIIVDEITSKVKREDL